MTPEAEAFRDALQQKLASMPKRMPDWESTWVETTRVFQVSVALFDEHLAPLRSLLGVREEENRRQAEMLAALPTCKAWVHEVPGALLRCGYALPCADHPVDKIQEQRDKLGRERDSAREELRKLKSAVNSVFHCRDGAKCDSYAHEEDCPAADGTNAVVRMGEELCKAQEMLAVAQTEKQGAEERAQLLLVAKNKWADRAAAAEGQRDAAIEARDFATEKCAQLEIAFKRQEARIAELEKALAARTCSCACHSEHRLAALREIELERALSEMTAMQADAAKKACRNESEMNAACAELGRLEARLTLAGELADELESSPSTAIKTFRETHSKKTWDDGDFCGDCAVPWPCPKIATLDAFRSAWDAGKEEEPEPCPTGACSPHAKNCTHEPEPPASPVVETSEGKTCRVETGQAYVPRDADGSLMLGRPRFAPICGNLLPCSEHPLKRCVCGAPIDAHGKDAKCPKDPAPGPQVVEVSESEDDYVTPQPRPDSCPSCHRELTAGHECCLARVSCIRCEAGHFCGGLLPCPDHPEGR